MVQEFRVAPKDRMVKWATILTITILVIPVTSALFLLFKFVWDESPIFVIIFSIIVLFALAALPIGYLYVPQKYLLNDEGVIIKRAFSLCIPYRDIKTVEAVEEVKCSLRLFGSYGYLGYFGSFLAQDADGKYKISKLYLTRRDHIVRIRTDSSIYYLSPAEPETFIEALKSRLVRRES